MLASFLGREVPLGELDVPLSLERMAAGNGPWEAEIGFGKGRYLLDRAAQERGRRFLGIEVAGEYYRRVRDRVRRRRLENVVLLHGEAVYLLAAIVPRAFAEVVHVYFPDPWPKARHSSRRLLQPETIDLVLGLLRPGGSLAFATDATDYGEAVANLLESHPAVCVQRLSGPWPDGPRTNYERKYESEGRPIVRVEAQCTPNGEQAATALLHPQGGSLVTAAVVVEPRGEAEVGRRSSVDADGG